MKKFVLLLSATFLIVSCQNNPKSNENEDEAVLDTVVADGVYGHEFDAENAISMDSLEMIMATVESMDNLKVSGEIKEVCQAEGCWMTVKKKDGSGMRVTFNDHAFFIPKDLAGKTAMFEGKAYIETTSVDDLRHYAEDEGKSKEEIAKITEPVSELVFNAHGVMIR